MSRRIGLRGPKGSHALPYARHCRDTFCRLKKRHEEEGLDDLKETSRRKPDWRYPFLRCRSLSGDRLAVGTVDLHVYGNASANTLRDHAIVLEQPETALETRGLIVGSIKINPDLHATDSLATLFVARESARDSGLDPARLNP